MILYISIYLLLLYDALVFYKVKKAQFIFLFLISFFIGFRGLDVGTDTANYFDMYESIYAAGYQGYPEPLYGFSCSLACLLGLSYPWHQTLLIFFSMILSYWAIKKSPNIGMSFFLLLTFCFFCYTMNIYGQMVACYISLFAYSFILDTDNIRKGKYILCVLFAMGFHLSAVFLLPLVLIHKLKFNGKVIIVGLLTSLVLGVVDITSLFSSYLMDYARYLERTMDVPRLVRGVLLSIYWIFLFCYLYRTSNDELRNRMELRIFFVGILFYNIFLTKDLALRFLLYFLIPMTIWIPIYLSQSGKRFYFKQSFIILYSSLYYFVILYLNSGDIVPYVFFK